MYESSCLCACENECWWLCSEYIRSEYGERTGDTPTANVKYDLMPNMVKMLNDCIEQCTNDATSTYTHTHTHSFCIEFYKWKDNICFINNGWITLKNRTPFFPVIITYILQNCYYYVLCM